MSYESRLLDGSIVWHIQDDIGVQHSLLIEAQDAISRAEKEIAHLEGMLPKGTVYWCLGIRSNDGTDMTVYKQCAYLDAVSHWLCVVRDHMGFEIIRSFEITEDEYDLHALDKAQVEFENIIFERVMP